MATYQTTLSEDVKENILQNLRNVYPGLLPSAMKNILNSEGWDLKRSLEILAALEVTSSSEQKLATSSPPPSVNGVRKSKADRLSATSQPASNGQLKATKRPLFPGKNQGTSQEASADQFEPKEDRKRNLTQNLEIIKQFKDPIDRIYACDREGIKILILMRGCPGSGKTSCARELLGNITGHNFDHHIISADDYFVVPETGKYHFDAEYIPKAHDWVKAVLKQLLGEGRSPLIVDNTHTRLWEMETTAALGVEYGYVIETLEPRTPWFFTEDQLVLRNTHGVHREAIKRMLIRYEPNITGPDLLRKLQLVYKNVVPPQKRMVSFEAPPTKAYVKLLNSRLYSNRVSAPMMKLPKPDAVPLIVPATGSETLGKSQLIAPPVAPLETKGSRLSTAVKPVWEAASKEYVLVMNNGDQELMFQHEKPLEVPRTLQEFTASSAAFRGDSQIEEASCTDESEPRTLLGRSARQDMLISFTQDSSTNTHYLDFEALNNAIPGNDSVLIGVGDRFQSQPALPDFSVPTTLTLEKSSMTVDVDVNASVGRESGVERLVKMFPGAALEGLEELFDRCQGNLDWVVNVLLDSGQELSEEFRDDDCSELVVRESEPPPPPPLSATSSDASSAAPSSPPMGFQEGGKKVKKNKLKTTTDGSEELAKRLAESFVLSESCYSERLKKVRETKYGIPSSSAVKDAEDIEDEGEEEEEDDEEEEDEDVTVVMNGSAIKSLQKKFGDATLNASIIDEDVIVRLPLNLARQLYSYAVESIYNQMEERENVMDTLFKEDEQMARILQGNFLDERPSSFQDIVEHEMAIQMSKSNSTSSGAPTMAGVLSKKLLIERFPSMDPATLNNILEDTNHSLHQATFLLTSAGHCPSEIETPPKPLQQDALRMTREESIKQADAYSDVSNKLYDLRLDCLKKAEQAYSSGNSSVASFYADLAKWHFDKIKESNYKAAKAMLSGVGGTNTLDLHFLLVSEAVQILNLYLDHEIRRMRDGNLKKTIVFIITGRGAHSINGVSRLKPVVQSQLKRRRIRSEEQNPGMLRAVISKARSLTSYEVKEYESKV